MASRMQPFASDGPRSARQLRIDANISAGGLGRPEPAPVEGPGGPDPAPVEGPGEPDPAPVEGPGWMFRISDATTSELLSPSSVYAHSSTEPAALGVTAVDIEKLPAASGCSPTPMASTAPPGWPANCGADS
jgi:hypothetical protein